MNGADFVLHLLDKDGKALCAVLAEEKIAQTEGEMARLFPFEVDKHRKLERRIRSLKGQITRSGKGDRQSAVDPIRRADTLCDACRLRIEKFPQLRNQAITARAAGAAA